MSTPLFDPYIAPFRPLSNITPFTYNDGVTYLETLEALRTFVNETIVSFINGEFVGLGDDFESEVNRLYTNVAAALTLQSANVTAEINAIKGTSVATNDPIIRDIVNNSSSVTRVALNALFGAKSAVDTLTALAVTTGGRLTQAQLDVTYGAKTVVDNLNTIIATGRLAQTSLDNAYGAKTTVDNNATIIGTGRLSQLSLDGKYSPLNLTGTYAARPAANSVLAGTLYFATNVPEVYRSNGTAWTVVSGAGNELASATLNNTQYSGVTTTQADVPGLSATFVAGERPVQIVFNGDILNDGTGLTIAYITLADNVVLQSTGGYSATAGRPGTYSVSVPKRGLTPGTSYTAKVRAATGSGTGKIGSTVTPTTLQVISL